MSVALAGGILFVALVVLGVMREVVILRGEVAALSQLITDPPPPSFLNERLPDALSRRLAFVTEGRRTPSRPHVVAFVSPGCEGCTALVRELRVAVGEGRVDPGAVSFVVTWADSAEPDVYHEAAAVADTVLDADGALARVCEVRATPTLLAVESQGLTVFAHKAGGDPEWVGSVLGSSKIAAPPATALSRSSLEA